MAPPRRKTQLLEDSEPEIDESMLNHSPEEKRDVRNKIEALTEKLETFRQTDVKNLYNNEGFQELMTDSKNLIKIIHNPQEFLDEVKLFKKLCRLVQEMSSDVDGNKQKFTTQMYVTSLGENGMSLDKDKSSDRYKMTPAALTAFGRRYARAFQHAPTFKFVLGTLNNESVGATPRKRVVKRPAAQKAKERGTTKIANIGKNQTVEALTDRYVKLTRKCLDDNYVKNGKKALCYFSFVIDPDSFGKTVENMFHVSFLIKQRVATLAIGKNGMPTIEPFDGDESDSDNENGDGDSIGSRIDQAVIDICQADWEELKTNLKITKKMIEIPSS